MGQVDSIDLLTRREIEARLLVPLLEALGQEFDRERVLEVARRTIIRIARDQGAQLAQDLGGNSLSHFNLLLDAWKKGGALEVEILEQSAERLDFNVTRCLYAEMYRALGVPELGSLLSCNRDHALIAGFNPSVEFTRTQTIMENAPICDFRFRVRKEESL